MNEWIRRSIEIAEHGNYLDQLSQIYPIPYGGLRVPLRPQVRRQLDQLFNQGDMVALIRFLLRLARFPYQEPYLGSIRVDQGAIVRNPRTIERVSQILFNMGPEEIVEGLERPKQVNTILGAMFKQWARTLPYQRLPEQQFTHAEGISLLEGSDGRLKEFCDRVLNCNLVKRPDLVAKTPRGYVIAEAKFVTSKGGNQDKSFREVLQFIGSNQGNAIRIGILDGVVWLDRGGLYATIRNVEEVALSALLLQEFLASL